MVGRTYLTLRLLFLALLFLCGLNAIAQNGAGALSGHVSDPSGAAVTKATISLTGPSGQARKATTDASGNYEFKGLAAGNYAVTVTALGFANSAQPQITITAGQTRRLDIKLALPAYNTEVTVNEQEEETPHVDVAPEANASSIIIKGKDLEALSDDPDELQSELQALAGPSVGPNGGQIYIDGFTGGELPPKSQIREIRINQNPFSAEYDKLGYGRIEIFTKPGTDQLHGQFFVNDNDSIFNSKNPFIASNLQPSYQSEIFNGNLSGPLNKNASFFFTVQRRNLNNTAIVAASDVPPGLGLAQQGVPTPTTLTSISPRLDYQLSQNNTLTVRYQFTQRAESNQGVGELALASQAYNVTNTENTLQISDTQVISPRTLNETRFQYMGVRDDQNPTSSAGAISVLGAFLAGGNAAGLVKANADHYELQNYTSMTLGTHLLKFGGRLRAVHDYDISEANFNGTNTYPSLAAYDANQFSKSSIVSGNPLATLTMYDAGLYAQDDWRIRPNLSLSYGLRFETQNLMSDHADWAPRFSVAWGLGKKGTKPKTVLRAGFGIFYDRFTDTLALQQEHLNGINEQETIESCSYASGLPSCTSALPTLYQVNPRLHAPYVVQSAVSIERQIGKSATVSLTYLNSNGYDQLLTRDLNAPLPGTYNPSIPSSGVYPLGNIGTVYQYQSAGIFRQNQLIANFRIAAGSRLSLFGFYALNYANSNTAGASYVPSNQYNLMQDYGRAAYGVRDRLFFAGSITGPYAFRLSPFIMATSGTPYNITLPEDLSGNNQLNSRPAFCTAATPEGDCDDGFNLATTTSDTPIPINYGTGPGQFTVNLRLAKTFGFGKKSGTALTSGPYGGGGGGHGGHGGPPGGGLGPAGLSGAAGGHGGMFGNSNTQRYNVTFSIMALNLFNRTNAAVPGGVLGSPLFDKSYALAGGPFGTSSASRRVDMQMMFSF